MEMSVEVAAPVGMTGEGAMPRTFRLPLGRAATVGRHQDTHITVPGEHVSRRHCDLWWDGCCVWVEDRGSLNGTSLNGHRIPTQVREAVRLGDRVQIGRFSLRLRTPLRAEASWLAWNGGTVPKIAQAIYEDQAFDRMPVLADALEDAGCTDAALLDHCRGPGPHVRGCWAVDLLLGKEQGTMTEAEWLACTDPTPMLTFLLDQGSWAARQRLLYCCACTRRCWGMLHKASSRRSVEFAEQLADAVADPEGTRVIVADAYLSKEMVKAAENDGEGEAFSWAAHAAYLCLHPIRIAPIDVAALVALAVGSLSRGWDAFANEPPAYARSRDVGELAVQAALLRDLIANPFRTQPPIQAAWLTWSDGAVRRLAAAVYQERELPSGHLDVARLSVLADALEEAGCADPDLLGHLRGPGPHVRGCWAIDVLLGKE